MLATNRKQIHNRKLQAISDDVPDNGSHQLELISLSAFGVELPETARSAQTLKPIVCDLRKSRTDSAVQRVLRNVVDGQSVSPRRVGAQETETDYVADLHMRNMTSSLFRAVRNGRQSRVRFLLGTAGVRSDVRNDLGQNLLVVALHVDDDDRRRRVFNFLLNKCAVDCESADSTTGRDIIAWAAILNRHEQVRQTVEWTSGDYDLSRPDYNGLTALHYAAAAGHIDVVKQLVSALARYRVSVEMRDNRFQRLTPYLYARYGGHTEVAELLVQAGASRHQFDTTTFMNGDDWEQLGRRRRQRQVMRLHRQTNTSTTSPSSRMTMTPRAAGGARPTNSDAVAMTTASRDLVHDVTGDHVMISPSPTMTKSTLTALLDLDKVSPGGTTVDRFVSSVREPEVTTASDRLPPLTSMMQLLSVQQSSSYRPPHMARRAAAGRRRRVGAKKKVSSLALTMGRQERHAPTRPPTLAITQN